jgi:hypothetical protein
MIRKHREDKTVIAAEDESKLRERLHREAAEELNPLQAAAVAAGRGVTSVGRGLGFIDQESPEVTQAFKALEKESPISTTVGEVFGEVAPFLAPGGAVAKVASMGPRIAAATGLGFAESGIISKGKGASSVDTLKSAGLGGAVAGTLEAVIPVIGKFGGRLYRKITGKNPTAPLINGGGQPTKEFSEALDKAGISFDDINIEASRLLETGNIDDAAQMARKQFLEAQGITPTRAQITGDKTQFQTQQELGKVTGRVSKALQGQEDVLAGRFENAITATGGSANASNSSAIDFIADKSIDLDQQISGAYKAARELSPTGKVISLNNTASKLSSLSDFEKSTGGLPSAVKGLLKNRGVVDSAGRLITSNKQVARDISKLKAVAKRLGMRVTKDDKVINALGQADKRLTSDLFDLNLKDKGRHLTVNEAEALRVDFNSLFDSLTPLGRRKLADVKSALDADVEKAIGQDIFGEARAAKAKFEKDLNRAKVNKFDRRNKNLVRDILDNKINPDRFFNDAILSKSIRGDDVQQLKNYLHLDNSPDGVKAWNDVRAEAMDHIKSKSIKVVGGEPALSRSGIESGLSSLGREKMMVLFNKQERKFLSDMLKTSKLREPKRGTALGKGPSAQAMKNVIKAIDRIPLINMVFGGALELTQTGVAGRAALRQPLQSSLKPSQFTRLTPVITTATTEERETQ